MVNISGKIQPVILVILDGWGIAPPSQGNAITLAKLPVFNKLIALYPTMVLQSAGEAVGLSWGESGNSEVGHLNLGAGQIVWQSLPLINRSIMDGSFFNNQAFIQAIEHAKQNKSNLHLIGLTSNGGIHSSIDHLYALMELAARNNFSRIYLHVILDGRDTAKDEGKGFIKDILSKIKSIGLGQIATLAGRFWAMDRDNHWERIETVYLAMTKGLSEKEFSNPIKAVESSYKNGIYDEEFSPVVITSDTKPTGIIKDNDAIIFYNFRADRTRELAKAFVSEEFNGFKRDKFKNLFFVAMTEYEKNLPVVIAFPPVVIKNPLARVISEMGLNQLHLAETEKYAHITFFFNGGREDPFEGEERILIPSPRIPSYDQKPEMSAQEVTHQILWAIDDSRYKYKFIAVNYANPDMVAHTGDLAATVKALEVLDGELGRVVDLALKRDWVVVITADHGNAEALVNLRNGEIDKEHNANPVPFIIVDKKLENKIPPDQSPDLSLMTPMGVLSDVAPTILKIMGIEKPEEMTGTSLI